MLKKYRQTMLMSGLFMLSTTLPIASFATPVDVELALLVDISPSIDNHEYNIQKQGYVNAFRNSTLVDNIASGAIGSIAVTYIEWSGASQQQVVVGWTEIFDVTSANNFADAIDNSIRSFASTNNGTAPGSAINFSVTHFGTETGAIGNGFESTRQVIDVSGDGEQNRGDNTFSARNTALSLGIDSINGLAILNDEEPGLRTWYTQNIVGGDNAFLEVTDGFDNFGEIVGRKINREVSAVPEPTTLALLAMGMLGMTLRRKALRSLS